MKIMDGVISAYTGCAIKKDGGLWTWGANSYGQVGDGTTADRYKPFKVMDNVTSISGGYECKFAIKNDGSLWAWGSNTYGQLGDGTTIDRHSPVTWTMPLLFQ